MDKEKFARIMSYLKDIESVDLENVRIDAEELGLELKKAMRMPGMMPAIVGAERKPVHFEIPTSTYKGSIAEVKLGATRAEGGSRKKVIKIGGQSTLYLFEGGIKNKPAVTYDTFDCPQPQFPKVLREAWGDVWDNPGEWAKKAVKLGVDMVTIHLVSTDPKVKDTSPREAAKTVEEVLQAVKVPVAIGGSGNPEKDTLVLEKAAEAASGERCLLASVNLDMDHGRVAKAAVKHNHNVLSFVALDINDQRTLNRLLLSAGLPGEQIVCDPTTGALGYGLEYTYTMVQRMKQSALKGDKELQMPISCAGSNAWGARESWKKNPEWGAREHRGPIWELVTSLTVLMAGADVLMMTTPPAAKMVQGIIKNMFGEGKSESKGRYEDWLSV